MTEKGTVVLTKEQLAIQKLRQKPMMERNLGIVQQSKTQ